MELSYGPAAEAYRAQVLAFLDVEWRPAEFPGTDRTDYAKAFRRAAVGAGYLYRNVPVQYGGSEQPADVIRAQIIREAFAGRRAPMEVVGNGPAMLAPTLLDLGADWQKEQFVRPTIEGDLVWAQGYSEPGAGSDLASVRTTAVLDDQGWLINGQKVWTTFGDKADMMFALVRTEPNASDHQALSYLLIDLRQPGVTIRPLRQMTGETNFSEVFLDDVRTPGDWMVGQRGGGWDVSRRTLSHERASIGAADRTGALFDKLVDLARHRQVNGRPALENADIRQRLAALEAWVLAQKYSAYRQFSLAAVGREPGLIALMNKLVTTEIGHDVARLAQDLIGEDALLALPGQNQSGARGDEKWLNQIMGSLGVAIAGGTSNIQRNIIAERGLGLPRDMAAGIPT